MDAVKLVELMPEFFPHFQPIVDIPTGRICGYEALARQRLDSGEIRSCGPYFSDNQIDRKFLRGIDRTVRKKALKSIKDLPDNTFLTLNISPEWIGALTPKCCVPTLEMIDQLGIDPKRVVIEITETEGDMSAIQRMVNLYRRYGMRIAIDDFGAGYSELGRVVALEPDLIKLDMRFFKSAVSGSIADDAIRAISFMAERIGSDILCEGVETEQEFNFAIDSGANMIQGFLFYKPGPTFVPPEDSKPLIKEKLTHFLESKVEREKAHIHYYRTILEHAHQIKTLVQNSSRSNLTLLPELATLPESPLGFIRFYICQKDGAQLSPNYDFYHGRWHEDLDFVGLNWSGRPYLHQVIALGDIVSRNEVTSRPYRDRLTRELFQTQGLRLDDGRILLVDYLVDA